MISLQTFFGNALVRSPKKFNAQNVAETLEHSVSYLIRLITVLFKF